MCRKSSSRVLHLRHPVDSVPRARDYGLPFGNLRVYASLRIRSYAIYGRAYSYVRSYVY